MEYLRSDGYVEKSEDGRCREDWKVLLNENCEADGEDNFLRGLYCAFITNFAFAMMANVYHHNSIVNGLSVGEGTDAECSGWRLRMEMSQCKGAALPNLQCIRHCTVIETVANGSALISSERNVKARIAESNHEPEIIAKLTAGRKKRSKAERAKQRIDYVVVAEQSAVLTSAKRSEIDPK
jgi:hypothetical protein